MRATTKAKNLVVRLSRNSIVLNKVTREQLNRPEYLELAFDTGTGTIRIRPAGKKTKVASRGFF
jgi:hypothetical protein